jgi:Protein of unknown function (DUF1579)
MNRKIALVVSLVLLAVSAWAQMDSKPGAEVKKLEYFVGTWSVDATIGQGPWGAGGKFNSTNTSEWMTGNFFLEGHSDFKMPSEIGGEGKESSFTGYDTDQNLYTRDAFNSQGRRLTSTGTVAGDTWTWNSTSVYSGQDIKQKMTIKVLSPTSYNLKLEISMDGTTWTTFMEGKATKK